MDVKIIFGILIPFIGTTTGSAMVFFLTKKCDGKAERILIGFASGVMIATSIWSLLIPSIDLSEESMSIMCYPTIIGYIFGTIVLIFINKIVNNLSSKVDYECKKIKDVIIMVIAIIVHNIPEGMAVGVAFASIIEGSTAINITQAMMLSIGIAIQNIPEGAIISMPLKNEGISTKNSFIYGVLSGIVEPIAAIITLLFSKTIITLLPLFLAFAAGAMFYVVINELIPENSGKYKEFGTFGFMVGFLAMMILDISF